MPLLRSPIARAAGLGLCLGLFLVLSTRVRAQDNMGFPVRVSVAQGELEGRYSTKTGVQTYFGIPFAAPPVGDLRWQPPQPAASWEGVREATEFGPRAIQQYVYDDMRFRSPMASEDCLYLNVWTPVQRGQTDLPVLVYYHGGGNTSGSGDELRYDGEKLAEAGIVVVTVNYRLGVFGFFAHPELSAEQGGHSGNYGILDQVAALEWVRDNIEAFGGDPARITIAGESAGSIDVSVLMTSPLSRDLLAGAVGQSGAAIAPTFTPISLADAEERGTDFARRMDYTTLAELRRAPTRDIYELAVRDTAGYRYQAGLVIDDYLLPKSPAEILAAGEQAKIPLLVGWTSAETAWAPAPASDADFEAQVRERFGDRADEILTQYPGRGKELRRTSVDFSSDNWIVYSTWKWAQLHASTSEEPVYRYRFDRVRPPLKGETRDEEPIGAAHATDIEYFLNTLDKSDAYAWQAADRTTAQTMAAYLVNFVKTGAPNGQELPEWGPMTAETSNVMHLNEESSAQSSETEGRYRGLDGYYSGK